MHPNQDGCHGAYDDLAVSQPRRAACGSPRPLDQSQPALSSAGIAEQADGYLVLETGEVIDKARVIWKSPDGAWWRCRFMSGAKAGSTRCLIGPPPNS